LRAAAVAALDLGTGSCKGALYSLRGERLALCGRDYPVLRPAPHFVEQEPLEYLRAAREVSAALAREAGTLGVRLEAAGLSTQTPTLVFCGEDGAALGPAMVWEDTRAGEESAWWMEEVSEETRREWFGMDLPLGAASTPAKLLWAKRHRPELWRAVRWVVQPKDYLAFDLTGEMFADRWCAKGIAHLGTGRAHPAYLELLGKTESPSPPVRDPRAVAGRVTGAAAERYGLPCGIPVTVGWSDALAGILACGAFHRERRGFVLSGTSEIIGVSRAGGRQAKGLFVVPAGLVEMAGPGRPLELHYGPTQAGGATLEWLCRLFGKSPAEVLSALDRPVEETALEIVFRPYLAGERAPYWDHRLRAGFEGIRVEHGMAELIAAALRGVALQERLVLEAAEAGTPSAEVVLAGGAARDRRWNQLRADMLQRKLVVLSDPEASLRGAAILAWAAVDPDGLAAAGEAWFRGEEVPPDGGLAAAAARLMERFRLPG
jgi:xylulokinase